jgi:EAL domain-containing protein (putative c-di-GMP-specific phosphodiesterase class I)/CheY-like chemotaxis protein
MTRILVIEDEESVRENLLDLLEAENFQTIPAANGKIGLKLAISELPDLILCDMMMPEVDGYGVLTALRQEPITAIIPFIFLTAKSAKSDFRQGMDMGADDYLTKPFTRAELLSAIMNKLAKYAALRKNLITYSHLYELNPRIRLLETNLRQVIQNKRFEEFEIYYQPILDIYTLKLIAAESLLRWKSPELGTISPTEFIPLAEKTGLIIDIGQWVLMTVCSQINSWRNAGINSSRIAVNLSAIEFNQPDLISQIVNLIESNNLPQDCLEIELTESMTITDIESIVMTMNNLQSLGIKIAIDDFGTGFTCLSYLKQLPANTIKIDRLFVHDVANDYRNAGITKSLIQLGHNLNLKIVAEGVETEAELSFLREHHCDAIQGFLCSKPLPVLEFEEFLVNNQSNSNTYRYKYQ